MSNFKFPVVAVAASMCVTSWAQQIDGPQLKAGDKWVYQVRSEHPRKETTLSTYQWSVVRDTARNLVVTIGALDSNVPPRQEFLNPDWSKAISLKGQETIIRKPFDFPLAPGKQWTIKWELDNLGPAVKFERDELDYRVVGWEQVTVPAGTFKALKIEADGSWYREYNEQGPSAAAAVASDAGGTSSRTVSRKPYTMPPQTGRRYQAWWYAPEVRREVKYIVENASSTGTLGNRESAELESFTPAP